MNSLPSETPAHQPTLLSVFRLLFQPSKEFGLLSKTERTIWRLPMLVLSLTALLFVVVSGAMRAHLASLGQPILPPDWEWWTPEMQENYMRAIQATQGPAFLYIIPGVSTLVGLWLRWLVLSALLHLASTLMGGRGTMRTALNMAAWASLPFALRDLLRVVYVLISGHPIVSPGLSGFVLETGSGTLFLAQLLRLTDLFLAWHVGLLIIGLRQTENLGRGKVWFSVLLAVVTILLVQAGTGMLGASLGSMVIFRPF